MENNNGFEPNTGNSPASTPVIASSAELYKRRCESLFNWLLEKSTSLSYQAISDLDEDDMHVQLRRISNIHRSFELSHEKLEEIHMDEIGSALAHEFASLADSLETRLQRAIRKVHLESPLSSTSHNNITAEHPTVLMQSRPRLPELKLPIFSGGYTEYADFISVFITIIDNDPELSKIEKLQHLRSCLRGSALDAVRSLEINSANYFVALDLLNKRFNNKRLIFQAHIMEILGLRKVESSSAAKLRDLSDKINAHMRALQSMGSTEQIADCILIHTLLQKVDVTTQSKWEESAPLDLLPSCEQFTSFLESRCQKLENMEHAMATYAPCAQVGKNNRIINRRVFVSTSANGCVFCGSANHAIYNCSQFCNLSPSLRLRQAKGLSLCLNCLRKGHQLRTCNSTSCKSCGSKHHSLLHLNTGSPATADSEPPTNSTQHCSNSSQGSARNLLTAVAPARSTSPTKDLHDIVLLATAVIGIKNRYGTIVPCRALLDSGSQLHIISSRLAQQLQLRKSKSSATVSGVGDAEFVTDGHTVNLHIHSQNSSYATIITALVAPVITDVQPNLAIDVQHWDIPNNIRLADPLFNKPRQIDLLIGASLFYELLCVGQIKLAPGLPLLQKTRLGWVATGGGMQTRNSALLVQAGKGSEPSSTQVEELLRRFWELEAFSESGPRLTREEADCEEHFNANITRLPSGEYSVRLPLKSNLEMLGDSYQLAYRRFLSLERKLERNPQLKARYSEFIGEYLTLNHMSIVPKDNLNLCKYFLPHHCVFKEDSSTTKLRVVFDGSASTTSGHSLNDILMAGPTIQPKLFSTLLRFRTLPVALTGDICKMYRCVRVSTPDSYLQCILWRDAPHQKMQVYRLDTVTYGTKPASFLSVRVMHQLATDEQDEFPIGSQVLRRDFYVDDLITGGNSVEEVIETLRQTKELLARGKFLLRKWCSNVPAVLNDIPEGERETFLQFDDGSNITKTLGLAWNTTSDQFLFSFSPKHTPTTYCKRSVLSTIARFYDPLGLLGPVITKAKIFLQALWKEKLAWDESLPASLYSTWRSMLADFSHAKELKFPRLAAQLSDSVEVHGFCDASLQAYGACVYLVSRTNVDVKVQLLCSRSRVAPVKSITVPKLELCGALLLSQLIGELTEMKLFSCKWYCWSDSTVVLSWLRHESSKFQIFVANRVAAIQQLTCNAIWRYVPTDLNPADILSRGSLPSELIQAKMWAQGPPFLGLERNQWPDDKLPSITLPELRKGIFVTSVHNDIAYGCKYVNSFSKLQRVFGYVSKFIRRNCNPGLSVECMLHGTHLLLRSIQRIHLSEEYKALQSGQCVRKSSSIASLAPFVDSAGLLRVGGRLKNSNLNFEARHPIILPRKHSVTHAIINHFHKRNLHAGPRASLASIRQHYWPIGGRKTVSSVLNKCITCFRAKPRLVEHIMADLPKERLSASRVFMVTGIDFCGPFYYKSSVRNRQPIKCYVCVFICFATKAVHLEIAKDLSTAAFLNALQRFICTRGRPSTLWSDNATNFVGAKNKLDELRRLFFNNEHIEAVQQFCLAEAINWRFIPPRSPHFGGLWEAAVKTAKYHFYRAVGPSLLDADGLHTLVCHIAAIINSRPLLPLSENPADIDVLTPAHFLGTANSSSYVEPDLTKLNVNRLDQWQRVTFHQQNFWSRWREEYIGLLQQRSKWRRPQPELRVNDVVLVKDENLPPLKWPLARILELIPGPDGVTRVAVLRTATGITKRATRRLCLLPTTDDC